MPSHPHGHPTHAYGSWEHLERKMGGAAAALVLFAALYAPLLWFDHALRESPAAGTVLRPSIGLLLIALWFSRPGRWPAFLVAHGILAVLVGLWLNEPFTARAVWFAVLPGAVSAIVGAAACRLLLRRALEVQVAQVPVAILGVVAGAVCGAAIATAISLPGSPGLSPWLRSMAAFSVEHALGALTTGPIALTWLQQLRHSVPELALRSRRELAWLAAWTIAPVLVGWFLLRGPDSSLLPVPLLAGPALILASLRLPPRWAVSIAALFVLPFCLLAASREAPYSVADPAVRIGLQQMLAGIFVVVPFILSVGIAQLRITMSSLARSEHRYRSFVQMSREAVWRLEVEPPMPVSLPRPEQLSWLREHAHVAESSLAHGWLDPPDATGSSGKWWTHAPWAEQFERILGDAPLDTLDVELLFTVTHLGRQHTYVASMQAVVEEGQVRRFWGVARDVTELSELNARLLANQDRLQTYARMVSEAEERARRETAIDLHDGIGQTLVGMQMMVDVARQRRPAELEPLLKELALRLHQVQDHTRRMITDLSPPGLYELGLAAALEWLALQLREHDGLSVKLTCNVQEAAIPVATRVLVFRLARELLRNAARHSGVLEATLEARGDAHLLRLKVSDSGQGFDGGALATADGSKGFGLWSIAERVRETGGRFLIDSAPEKGARFELEIPLKAS